MFEKVTRDEHSSLFCRSLTKEKRNILGHCTKTIFLCQATKSTESRTIEAEANFFYSKNEKCGEGEKGRHDIQQNDMHYRKTAELKHSILNSPECLSISRHCE